MHKIFSGGLIVPYLLLFYIFYILFGKIEPIYIKADCLCDPARNYPIDMRAAKKGGFFDTAYVVNEAKNCYSVPGYFRSFFPLDMLFPLVYTFLMLSMISFSENIWVNKFLWIRAVLIWAIWIGMGLDYGEDFSFAGYLTNHAHGLAVLTSWFTTFKTCLLVFNGVSSITLLLWRWLK